MLSRVHDAHSAGRCCRTQSSGGGPAGQQHLRLGGGARVTVGARPQLPAVAAIQDQATAHAGAADGQHRPRIGHHVEDFPDAGADQRPVAGGVEILGAGHAVSGWVRPFPLGQGDLAPGQIEQDRAGAAGARVQRQEVAVTGPLRPADLPNSRGKVPSGRIRRHR
jgi:hypothetical protein